jgi:hypothetical protein
MDKQTLIQLNLETLTEKIKSILISSGALKNAEIYIYATDNGYNIVIKDNKDRSKLVKNILIKNKLNISQVIDGTPEEAKDDRLYDTN